MVEVGFVDLLWIFDCEALEPASIKSAMHQQIANTIASGQW
jgi:hypothetical protein